MVARGSQSGGQDFPGPVRNTGGSGVPGFPARGQPTPVRGQPADLVASHSSGQLGVPASCHLVERGGAPGRCLGGDTSNVAPECILPGFPSSTAARRWGSSAAAGPAPEKVV